MKCLVQKEIPSAAAYGLIELTNPSGLRLQVLPSGELFAIRHGATLINQALPTPAERGMHRLVLRQRGCGGDGFQVADLIGDAAAFVLEGTQQVSWSGTTAEWEYTVDLVLHPELPLWSWQVWICNRGAQARTFDLLHGQDLGLADEAGVRGNEAYISQYIDHCPVTHPVWGTVLFSRQNMAQSENAHPWLAHVCVSGSAAFATDGFQFFGLGQRLSGAPEAYQRPSLPSQRLQYEFAYSALQTAPVTVLPGGRWETSFFALYQQDHAAASGDADLAMLDGVREFLEQGRGGRLGEPSLLTHADCDREGREASPRPPLAGGRLGEPSLPSVMQAPVVAGHDPAETDLAQWFPGAWRQVERDADGHLLSFFYGAERHVVTRRKEALVERPHGHLLRSGQELWLCENALGSTVYACGVFNAQVYLGNTTLARGLSVVRNALDVMASSGQRVLVRRTQVAAGGPPAPVCGPDVSVQGSSSGAGGPPPVVDGSWRRLGIPSAFEIRLDQVRWIYQLGETCLEAVTCMDGQAPRVTLTLRVLAGPPCEFLVTHLLVMGDREMDQSFAMTVDAAAACMVCAPDPKTLLGEKRPDLRFMIAAAALEDVACCGGDELLFADGQSRRAPYAVLQSKAVEGFTVTIEGRLAGRNNGGLCPVPPDTETAVDGRGFRAGLPRLQHPAAGHVDEILPWFAHNACTHFTAPRGLEQYGGAAWGVRDVCQGPVEWLLATRQFAPVRRMLVQVFEQQYADSGCWPQWFMVEPYRFIQSVHAHGDVPFWPIKALCDYVEATGDFALLNEVVPYTDAGTFTATPRRETMLAHALRVVDVFESRRIPGTALVNYGEGDWDDTLQPADPLLRSNMVSAWTAALAYQVFQMLQQLCVRGGCAQAAERLAALLPAMQADFQRLLLPDGVLAGFLVFGEQSPRPLLHPRDRLTGIRYRLLPMTRAMLAELLTPAQAVRHLALIREHLLFPDGVRLMSDPVPYHGGVERWFKRAETAANFGREIGLMYAHAHLRYIEALGKAGRPEELWEMLGRVTPVQLQARVANAALRQANVYYSSSDGAFADRYEAAARFNELRNGTVAVKGGWRIYSSGAGLYLHRVICCLLGIRDSFGDIVFDPVLPRALDGLVVELERDGREIQFRYQVGTQGFGPTRICVNGQELALERHELNPYRTGGVRIAAEKFAALLGDGTNVVEIAVA